MQWFRFYSETIGDPKLRRLARDMNASPAEAIGLWAILLALASSSPERGRLLLSAGIPITAEDLSQISGLANIDSWLVHMSELSMITRNLVGWQVTHWDARQFTSDDVNVRVKKHRSKNSETLQQRFCNAPEADTDTESTTTTTSNLSHFELLERENLVNVTSDLQRDDVLDLINEIPEITHWTEAITRARRYAPNCTWGLVRKILLDFKRTGSWEKPKPIKLSAASKRPASRETHYDQAELKQKAANDTAVWERPTDLS